MKSREIKRKPARDVWPVSRVINPNCKQARSQKVAVKRKETMARRIQRAPFDCYFDRETREKGVSNLRGSRMNCAGRGQNVRVAGKCAGKLSGSKKLYGFSKNIPYTSFTCKRFSFKK